MKKEMANTLPFANWKIFLHLKYEKFSIGNWTWLKKFERQAVEVQSAKKKFWKRFSIVQKFFSDFKAQRPLDVQISYSICTSKESPIIHCLKEVLKLDEFLPCKAPEEF